MSCACFPASLFASASVSPHERRTHTIFAVWCLGSSRACGGSTNCLPVHVLTHVFAARGSVSPRTTRSPPLCTFVQKALSPELFATWSWIPPCCVLCGCSVHRPEHLVAEPVSRWSAHCAFRRTLLCSVSRDRALDCSGSTGSRRHPSQVISLSTDAIVVWLSLLRPPGCTPAEAQSLRLFATVAAGGWLQALLDADMLELIDRSACEPVVVESCAPPPVLVLSPQRHVQRRVRSLLANSPSARPCGKSFAP